MERDHGSSKEIEEVVYCFHQTVSWTTVICITSLLPISPLSGLPLLKALRRLRKLEFRDIRFLAAGAELGDGETERVEEPSNGRLIRGGEDEGKYEHAWRRSSIERAGELARVGDVSATEESIPRIGEGSGDGIEAGGEGHCSCSTVPMLLHLDSARCLLGRRGCVGEVGLATGVQAPETTLLFMYGLDFLLEDL